VRRAIWIHTQEVEGRNVDSEARVSFIGFWALLYQACGMCRRWDFGNLSFCHNPDLGTVEVLVVEL
jgi:hypothetical protein